MRRVFALFIVFSCSFALLIHSDKDYEFQHTKAQFGLDYLNNTYSGILKVVEPFNACSKINLNLTGYIGLATRDKLQNNCSFSTKVVNIQNAGGIGAIIMNEKPIRWEEDILIIMANDTNVSNIVIPSIFILYSSGQQIIDLLSNSSLIAEISSQGETQPTVYSILSAILGYVFLFVAINLIILVCSIMVECSNAFEVRENVQKLKSIVSSIYTPSDVENPRDCTICLETLKQGDEVKKLPCGHVFHSACVTPWLMKKRAVCPVCRRGIFDDDMLNWMMEGKRERTERLVGLWELNYKKSITYRYGIGFFVVAFVTMFVYALFLWVVCWIREQTGDIHTLLNYR